MINKLNSIIAEFRELYGSIFNDIDAMEHPETSEVVLVYNPMNIQAIIDLLQLHSIIKNPKDATLQDKAKLLLEYL